MSDKFKIGPLGGHHDRAAFSCGKDPLDQYLRNQAGQAAGKNLAAVFILTPDGKKIAGYYALSSYVVKLDEIPEAIAKEFYKHYGFVPLPGKPNRLFLPMSLVQKMLSHEEEGAGASTRSEQLDVEPPAR